MTRGNEALFVSINESISLIIHNTLTKGGKLCNHHAYIWHEIDLRGALKTSPSLTSPL